MMINGILPAYFHSTLTSEGASFRQLIKGLTAEFIEAKFTGVPKATNVVNISSQESTQGIFTRNLGYCTAITLLQFDANDLISRMAMFHVPGGLVGWVADLSAQNTQQIADNLLSGFAKNRPLCVIITDGPTEKLDEYEGRPNRTTVINTALKESGFQDFTVENNVGECVAVSFEPNKIQQLLHMPVMEPTLERATKKRKSGCSLF